MSYGIFNREGIDSLIESGFFDKEEVKTWFENMIEKAYPLLEPDSEEFLNKSRYLGDRFLDEVIPKVSFEQFVDRDRLSYLVFLETIRCCGCIYVENISGIRMRDRYTFTIPDLVYEKLNQLREEKQKEITAI